MTITLKDLYNEVTGQPWSMFDGDVESQDEFESTVTLSIQKALGNLWNIYNFPFKLKDYKVTTKQGKAFYNTPIGNIARIGTDYGIRIDKTPLDYLPDYLTMPEKEGKPEYFYIKNDRLYLYPTPDDVYTVNIEYYALYPAVDGATDEDKYTLINEDDYINIPERYEQIFKNALLPLAMVYAIASNSDENHSGYQRQYEDALQILIDFSQGVDKYKYKGW